MMQRHIKVFCVANFFVPGFKGGGPIRSIANLANSMPDWIRFDVFTRDRDLGSKDSYSEISVDAWSKFGPGRVYYASPSLFGVKGIGAQLRGDRYDVVYFNNLVGVKSSILPHLWNSFGFGPRLPTLIATRGGLTPGALSKNPLRKKIFLFVARLFGLYNRVHWHASSQLEAEDILRQFPDASPRIHIAPDLISVSETRDEGFTYPVKTPGQLRLVFLSRISPMKNLLGLIEYLSHTNQKICFDIFGPIEDATYWRDCQDAIEHLPENVVTRFRGPVLPHEVSKIFSEYDAFALPTFGENFGHVIFECLQAGTPVVISDRTIWRSDTAGSISTFSLDEALQWARKFDELACLDAESHAVLRRAARSFAENYIMQDDALDLNVKMFEAVAQGG